MTPEDTQKCLQKASEKVQLLITGKGEGAVFVIYLEGDKAEFNFVHIRMSEEKAIGLLEKAKVKLLTRPGGI